jgi:hypothetical protein
MGQMPEWLAKTPEMAAVDAYFGERDEVRLKERYRAALDKLVGLRASAAGLTAGRALTNPGRPGILHFDQDWLNGRFWPNIPRATVETKLREGFIEAIEAAMAGPLPLSLVWVCADPDYRSNWFEVAHVVGPTGVQVVVSTPMPRDGGGW